MTSQIEKRLAALCKHRAESQWFELLEDEKKKLQDACMPEAQRSLAYRGFLPREELTILNLACDLARGYYITEMQDAEMNHISDKLFSIIEKIV